MSTTLESKDIGIRKSEFVGKTQFLLDHGSGLPLENEWTGIAVAAVAVIIVFMFVVGVLITSRPKPI